MLALTLVAVYAILMLYLFWKRRKMKLKVQNVAEDVKIVHLEEEEEGDVNVYVGDDLVVFFRVEDGRYRLILVQFPTLLSLLRMVLTMTIITILRL